LYSSEISGDRRPGGETWSETLTGRVLELVASGQATSRTELARQLGAAASTVSIAVAQLIAHGLLADAGVQSTAYGRPRKTLRIGRADEYAPAAELGSRHARIGIVRTGGAREAVTTIPLDVSVGPVSALDALADALRRLIDAAPGNPCAIGLALPGPVDLEAGGVDSPSRMPGWHGYPVREHLAKRFGVPAAVGNDANLMAIGETAARHVDHQHSVTVKAGTAIGAGIMIDGRLYRGATGAAGDISHVRVDGAGDTPCACGNVGCLETVATGAALQRILTDRGLTVQSTEDVVTLVQRGDPIANQAVRRAGGYLGEVLSANVNFFNPDVIYLGGLLSTLEPFVAAVRSQLYESCHPLMTQNLSIERTLLGADAGLVGAGLQGLAQALATTLESIAGGNAPIRRRARV
jgi:predicted NBD/HSP70 family sugar kinase